MRHDAWLNASCGNKTRRELLTKDDPLLAIAPDDGAEWLVQIALECGVAQAVGSGIGVVAWAEVSAWQQVTGRRSVWLAETVRHLSRQYVAESVAARDPDRISPMHDVIDTAAQRRVVSRKLKAFFANARGA